jgi:hypothetical protein
MIKEIEMKKLILVLGVLSLTACTDKSGAINALQNSGLEPVKVGGHAWFACSEKDKFSTKFIAKRADGKIVKGAVCRGFFKGSTVRFK